MGNIEEIRNIYFMYANQADATETGRERKAFQNLMGYLKKHGVPEVESDEYVSMLKSTCDESGFINGFRYALKLLMGGGDRING